MNKSGYSMQVYPVIYRMSRLADNEQLDLVILDRPGQVKHVSYSSDAALGAGVGIDVLDGGSDGTGTDVIASSSDNLNGDEENASPDTTYSYMADGDRIIVLCDDFTAATNVNVEVLVHHYR